MHTCIHAYIHTYIILRPYARTYIKHTYMHTYIYKCICIYILHTYRHTYTHKYKQATEQTYMQNLTYTHTQFLYTCLQAMDAKTCIYSMYVCVCVYGSVRKCLAAYAHAGPVGASVVATTAWTGGGPGKPAPRMRDALHCYCPCMAEPGSVKKNNIMMPKHL